MRLHLDSKNLSLRGDIRVDIPRIEITDVRQVEAGLEVSADGPQLFIELSASDARRWQKALLKKPP